MVPSLSRRRRTRVGWPDFGSSSITFDAAIGAGNSMIPLSPWGVVARLCFFTTFTPSTTTRNCLGYTCRTLPSRPRSSPRITRTRSPLATWSLWRAGSRSVRRARRLFLKTSGFMSDHLRRERHDLHELLLAQLAPDRPEDAGRARLALVGDEHRGVLVEPDVRAILALGLLGGPDDDGPHHLALLDLPGRDGVLDRDDDDVAQPTVAALGAAKHADDEGAPRARVVGDLDDRFLLDHDPSALLRALDDVDYPPPLQLRQRPRLHDADGVAQLRPALRPATFCCSWSLDSSRSASGFCLGILAPLPPHEPGPDRQLGRRERQRQARLGLGDPFHLEHHATRLHDGHPSLGVALPLPHAGLGRLLGDRLVRKQTGPHLAAPLHLPRQRHP